MEEHRQQVHKLETLKEKFSKAEDINGELKNEKERMPGGWLREKDYGK